MEFLVCFNGKIKKGILTGPKGQFKIPYTLQLTFLCPLKTANFPTPSRRGCPSSRKILREIQKFAQPQNRVCISQKTLSKGFELAASTYSLRWTTPAGPCHADITDPPPVANRNRTDIPYNHSGNRPFFKCLLSKCTQFSGRYLCSNRRLIPEFTPSSGDFRRFRIVFPRKPILLHRSIFIRHSKIPDLQSHFFMLFYSY